jgi:hypothetical protein
MNGASLKDEAARHAKQDFSPLETAFPIKML